MHMLFQVPRFTTNVAANPKGMVVSVLNTHTFILDNDDNVHYEGTTRGPSSVLFGI